MEGGNPSHLVHFTSYDSYSACAFVGMVGTHAHFIKGAYVNLGSVFKKHLQIMKKQSNSFMILQLLQDETVFLKLEAEIVNVDNEFMRKGL